MEQVNSLCRGEAALSLLHRYTLLSHIRSSLFGTPLQEVENTRRQRASPTLVSSSHKEVTVLCPIVPRCDGEQESSLCLASTTALRYYSKKKKKRSDCLCLQQQLDVCYEMGLRCYPANQDHLDVYGKAILTTQKNRSYHIPHR